MPIFVFKRYIKKKTFGIYDLTLIEAYQAVIDGLPVLRTTRECNFPQRLQHSDIAWVTQFNIDCTNPDPKPLLSQTEETKLVN